MALFGETFARPAGAPLDVSGRALNEARMGEGVRQLERARLEGALQQGIQATAVAAGVPEAKIASLLPQEELQGALDRLQKRQERAVNAIQRQEMTVATFAMPSELPTSPSASEQLTSLSVVFSRDKEMATKLRDLAFEVAAWEALLKRCASTLDNDGELQQSFRRKRMLRLLATWGVLGLAGVIVAVGAIFFTLEARRKKQEEERIALERAQAEELRKQVAAILAQPDPCTEGALSPEQSGRLSDEQKKQLAERQQRCEDARQKKARLQHCEELAAHLEAGKLTAEDAKTAGAAAETLQRLAGQPVTAVDLNLPADTMPCQGTGVEPKFWAYLARKAAGGGPNLWGLAEGVSPRLAEALLVPGVLHPSTVLAIAFRSEKLATIALTRGREDDIKKARSLCDLKVKLGQAMALSCMKILK